MIQDGHESYAGTAALNPVTFREARFSEANRDRPWALHDPENSRKKTNVNFSG